MVLPLFSSSKFMMFREKEIDIMLEQKWTTEVVAVIQFSGESLVQNTGIISDDLHFIIYPDVTIRSYV